MKTLDEIIKILEAFDLRVILLANDSEELKKEIIKHLKTIKEGWISVKDRLPELDKGVLCYSKTKDIYSGEEGHIISLGRRFVNYTQEPVFVSDSGMLMETTEVLFWMPLPPSPTKE